MIAAYYRVRQTAPRWRRAWLYMLLSFAFYIPVAVGAGLLPMLGMLMLPKTVCYMLLIVIMRREAAAGSAEAERQPR